MPITLETEGNSFCRIIVKSELKIFGDLWVIGNGGSKGNLDGGGDQGFCCGGRQRGQQTLSLAQGSGDRARMWGGGQMSKSRWSRLGCLDGSA